MQQTARKYGCSPVLSPQFPFQTGWKNLSVCGYNGASFPFKVGCSL